MDKNQRDGAALVLTSSLGYSFFTVFVTKLLDGGLQPLDIGLWRFLIATIIFWTIIHLFRVPAAESPLPRLQLLANGAFLAAAAVTAFFGLQLIPAAIYIMIFYSYPALVAVISLFMGERLPPISWLALCLTLIGVALTLPEIDLSAGLGDNALGGVVLALGNGVVVSLYFIWGSRLLRGHTAVMRVTAWGITGAFLAFLLAVPFTPVSLPATPTVWGYLAGLVLVSTIYPIFALTSGIKKLGATRAAILSTIEPVFGLVWATLLLGERLQPVQLLGGAIILASVVLLQFGRRAQTPTFERDTLQPVGVTEVE